MEDEYSWDIADTRLAALYARVMNRVSRLTLPQGDG